MRHAPCATDLFNQFFFLCPEMCSRFAKIGNNIITLPTNIQFSFNTNINSARQSREDFVLSFFHWWNLWCQRNNIIFNNAIKDSIEAIKMKTINSYNFQKANHKMNNNKGKVYKSTLWTKTQKTPPPNTLELNSDGSTKQNGICQLAFIIRNNT